MHFLRTFVIIIISIIIINNTCLLTADKSKDDSSKTEEGGTVSGGETEEPPTTYTIKEKYHYFKPRVEVETEEEGNKSHIKEIYIRGDLNLRILIQLLCLPVIKM